MSFRDLNGDGTPELLLSLYTGGAHCCSVTQVFDFAGGTPHKSEIDTGDSGAQLVTIGSAVLFKSADPSFDYVFTDYADSGAPITLWRYSGARFINVTRSYPTLVRADAAFWWKLYQTRRKSGSDVRGFLSAWAADQAMLGRAAAAKTTLLSIAYSGALDRGFGGAKGSTYVRALWRFLAKEGYLR